MEIDQTPSAVPADVRRSTWRLVTDPLFGPYFFGKLISTAGVWVFNIVAAVIAWDSTGSTFIVGLVSAALFLPQLLLAPLSGAQADRHEPKRQLVFGRLLVSGACMTLAIVLWLQPTGALVGAWSVIMTAGVVGIGFVVGGPAQHSLLPALVRPSELAQGIALNSLPPVIARSTGPALGSLLLVAAGPVPAFVFAGLANLIFAVVLVGLPLAGRVQRADPGSGTVRAGLAHLRQDRGVSFLLLGVLAIGWGADPVVTLTPALAAALGAGDGLVGALASAFGLGAAAGYAVLARARARLGTLAVSRIGMGMLAGSMALTGLAPGTAAALLVLAMAGTGFTWSLTALTTLLYERVPETLRGRVMALWSMAFLGSRPVAAAISGVVADAAGVSFAFALVGTVVAGLGIVAHRPLAGATGFASPTDGGESPTDTSKPDG